MECKLIPIQKGGAYTIYDADKKCFLDTANFRPIKHIKDFYSKKEATKVIKEAKKTFPKLKNRNIGIKQIYYFWFSV